MCQLCGCQDYISHGAEAVLKRALEIVEELGLTPQNMDLFEDCESVCDIITPRAAVASAAPEIWETAQWVRLLHTGLPGVAPQPYAEAARDIFARLPGQGNAKEVITTYHQLEQLQRHISQESLDSLADARIKDTILALRHIHDNPNERRARIAARYKLPST